MEQTSSQLLDLAFRKLHEIESILTKLRPMIDESPKSKDFDKKLKNLIMSDKWPLAVELRHLGDPNSDDHKLARAKTIIDRLIDTNLTDKKVLDYGCGEGFLAFAAADEAAASIGYDPCRQGWAQFPDRYNLGFVQDYDDLAEHAPFDLIVLYDVLDHIEEEDPSAFLKGVIDLMADDGRLFVYCHPWCSRHGGHNYHGINKAYSQLLFPSDDVLKVLRPMQEYKDWFSNAGLVINYEKAICGDIPAILQVPAISDRIKELYESDTFPAEHLKVEGIAYSLSKKL